MSKIVAFYALAVFALSTWKIMFLSSDMPRASRVAIIARHGDRTPSIIPAAHESFWRAQLMNTSIPSSRTQLTKRGDNEMHELGRKLARTYGYLSNEMTHSLGFYSTDYDRTKQSAGIVASEFGSFDVQFQPRKNDPLDPWESISSYPKQVMDFWARPLNTEVLVHDNEFRDELIMAGGALQDYFPNTASFDWVSALDVVFCTSAYPDAPNFEAISNIAAKVIDITTKQFSLLYADDSIRKQAVCGLIAGICEWISPGTEFATSDHNFRINEKDDFAFISCHDTNLLPLWIALNQDRKPSWPAYGYYIAFELVGSTVHITDSSGSMRQKMSLAQFNRFCEAESFMESTGI